MAESDRLDKKHKKLEEASAGIKDLSGSGIDPSKVQTSDVRDASNLISEDFSLEDKPRRGRTAGRGRRSTRGQHQIVQRPRVSAARKAQPTQTRGKAPPSKGRETKRTTHKAAVKKKPKARARVPASKTGGDGEGSKQNERTPAAKPRVKVKAPARAAQPTRVEEKRPEDIVGIDVDADVTDDELEKMDSIMMGDEWTKCPRCGAMKKAGSRCPRCGF